MTTPVCDDNNLTPRRLALIPNILPQDAEHALLVGRVWRDDQRGPAIVALRADKVIDLSAHA